MLSFFIPGNVKMGISTPMFDRWLLKYILRYLYLQENKSFAFYCSYSSEGGVIKY